MNNYKLKKKKRKYVPLTVASKFLKYLGIHITKCKQNLHIEIYKTGGGVKMAEE